jgi:16S rRNA U516 pseudouridylate synthase RsuA-like enzyme
MIIFHIISKVTSYKVVISRSEPENLIYDQNTAMNGQTKIHADKQLYVKYGSIM